MSASEKTTVTMYVTATCPYCIRARVLLTGKGITNIETIRVDLEPQRRQDMITRTGRYTVPQIFIGEIHIGGCDDLFALDDAGGLDELLSAAAMP